MALDKPVTEIRPGKLLALWPDGMILLDSQGTILFANPAAEKMFGREPGELEGHLFGHPIGDERSQEIRIVRADGSLAFAELHVAETDENGTPVFLVALSDITERKRMEMDLKNAKEALSHSNDDLQQFAYAASHDLREPLRTVNLYLQLLEKRFSAGLGEEGTEYLSFVTDGVCRMQNLVDGLLAFSRLETRKESYERVRGDTIIDEVRDDLQLAIDEAGGRIVIEDELPEIYVSRSQVRQVFANLIGNAIKYRHPEVAPEVRISASEDGGGMVRFSIQDNGIGIEPAYADKVFKIFQRLHSNEQYEGTGIGLAICKKVVERHGGRIWLDSEPGKGSAFHFTLSAKPRSF